MNGVTQRDSGTRAIRPSGDYAGLRRAACELLEEGFYKEEDERVRAYAARAANAEAVLASMKKRRTLAAGYYVRVLYLWELKAMIDTGLQIRASDVTGEEWRGLQAVELGRADFERYRRRCAQCGGLNDQLSQSCRWCKREFSK